MQDASEHVESRFGVYILQKDTTPEYRIIHTLTPPAEITPAAGERLVYIRYFDHIGDALGYKLFLEHLSDESIARIIKNNASVP